MHDSRLFELRQDLTKFQVRTLAITAAIGPAKGLDIMDELESFYGTEINHGRLYPNLDELEDLDLVEIRRKEPDSRSNAYEITGTGLTFLEETVDWLSQRYEESLVLDPAELEAVADGGVGVEHRVLDRDEAEEIMADAEADPDADVDADGLLDELEEG